MLNGPVFSTPHQKKRSAQRSPRSTQRCAMCANESHRIADTTPSFFNSMSATIVLSDSSPTTTTAWLLVVVVTERVNAAATLPALTLPPPRSVPLRAEGGPTSNSKSPSAPDSADASFKIKIKIHEGEQVKL